MSCCVVFVAAVCFVAMVTGKLVTNPIPQKHEQCLTNQQCGGKGTSQSVILDSTIYCCKASHRMSITTGWDKLLMRLSQSLGKMLFTTLLRKTAPDLVRTHSDSTHSQSSSADSSNSDSSGSFSDSESLEKRSDSESMESRSIPGSDESLEYVDGRSIVENLDCSNGCGNDARTINRRRLSNERIQMGSKKSREATLKDSIFSNTNEKRAVDQTIQKLPTLTKTTREDSNIERWIRDYFRTELNFGNNQKAATCNWTAILIYLLNRKYTEHNDKPTSQDTYDLSPNNIMEKDEEQIPNAISSDLQNRDAESDSEIESIGNQNRDHYMPRDEVASATFNGQQSLNENAIRGKRLLNKDPKHGPANKGLKNTGTGVNNTPATVKGNDTKNLANTTKTGVSQPGPTYGAKGKQRYFTCKCLPGY